MEKFNVRFTFLDDKADSMEIEANSQYEALEDVTQNNWLTYEENGYSRAINLNNVKQVEIDEINEDGGLDVTHMDF